MVVWNSSELWFLGNVEGLTINVLLLVHSLMTVCPNGFKGSGLEIPPVSIALEIGMAFGDIEGIISIQAKFSR